jgi:hypothetical protein
MFFNEHNPPHFHAEYGEYRIIVDLNDEVVKGFMPKRALILIFEWLELHKEELIANWKICQNKDIPKKIEPLK